jgi:hypothetical protein
LFGNANVISDEMQDTTNDDGIVEGELHIYGSGLSDRSPKSSPLDDVPMAILRLDSSQLSSDLLPR